MRPIEIAEDTRVQECRSIVSTFSLVSAVAWQRCVLRNVPRPDAFFIGLPMIKAPAVARA